MRAVVKIIVAPAKAGAHISARAAAAWIPAFAGMTVLFLTACARTAPPAPVAHYGLNLRQMAIAAAAVPLPPSVRRAPPVVLPRHAAQKQKVRYVLVSPSSPPRPAKRAGEGGISVSANLARPVLAAPPVARAGEKGDSLIWPVRGRVISSYGPKDGGYYNDGINIAAPRGTPVKAAADGVVAYVGHDLESYGNLVLIRHAGGIVTAYAHLDGVRVKKGAAIRKGQAIGAVGMTGAVTAAQLHFEIRERGDAVDPVRHLG